MPCGTLYTCRSDTPILGSRHVLLYPLDTVPTEKTHGSEYSPLETEGCKRNLYKEHENEEDEDFKEDTSEINNTNESKLSKNKTEVSLISRLAAKFFSFKLIQVIIFSINTYEQDMIAVDNKNTDGIIVTIYLCYHCWGRIIVYPYFIWLNV